VSWPLVKLGECCAVVGGATPKREIGEYWNSKDIPWVTPKDISSLQSSAIDDAPEYISEKGFESCSAQMIPQGSILLTSRAPIGNVAIAGRAMCTNQGFKSLIPGPQVFGPFLYHCIKKYVPKLEALGNGATFKEVSKKVVEDFEIPLPPLPEQKRIAAILDKADAIRRKRQQAIKLADDFLRSVFLEMFGDPAANPKGWDRCKFEDLTDMVTYGLTVRPEYIDDGIPLISAKEIRSGTINLEICSRISEADLDALSSKARPNYGDILFSKTGSIGHCALVDTEEPFAITQNAARIVPNTKRCISHFLLGLLRTKYFYNLANKEAKGNAVKDLQLGVMKAFSVYAPPLELQRKYSEILQKFTGQSLLQEVSLKRAEENFNSLSQKAFLGSL
jgi:type I restriction enzyme, S subunit